MSNRKPYKHLTISHSVRGGFFVAVLGGGCKVSSHGEPVRRSCVVGLAYDTKHPPPKGGREKADPRVLTRPIVIFWAMAQPIDSGAGKMGGSPPRGRAETPMGWGGVPTPAAVKWAVYAAPAERGGGTRKQRGSAPAGGHHTGFAARVGG